MYSKQAYLSPSKREQWDNFVKSGFLHFTKIKSINITYLGQAEDKYLEEKSTLTCQSAGDSKGSCYLQFCQSQMLTPALQSFSSKFIKVRKKTWSLWEEAGQNWFHIAHGSFSIKSMNILISICSWAWLCNVGFGSAKLLDTVGWNPPKVFISQRAIQITRSWGLLHLSGYSTCLNLSAEGNRGIVGRAVAQVGQRQTQQECRQLGVLAGQCFTLLCELGFEVHWQGRMSF